MATPALVFTAVNLLGGRRLGGWAIPAATDIAFALAVLAVAGSALPTSLRAFLLTLAVVDDLVVIVIIALFYTSSLHLVPLAAARWCCSRRTPFSSGCGSSAFLVYVPLAAAVWWCVHESGVHATVAGVALGLLTRVLPDEDEARSPAERLEHRLTPVSAGVAVPFFALLSAGVVLHLDGAFVTDPVVVGVVLGLVVGKPVGVLGGAWAVTRFTRAELNADLSWRDLAGVAVLAGVGFTVALLVSDLSFGPAESEAAKTAVLVGSVVAGLLAALVLGRRSRTRRLQEPRRSVTLTVHGSPVWCRYSQGHEGGTMTQASNAPVTRPHSDVPSKDDPTIGRLFADASRDISSLVRQEIALAKSELQVSVKAGGIGIGLFAGAGVPRRARGDHAVGGDRLLHPHDRARPGLVLPDRLRALRPRRRRCWPSSASRRSSRSAHPERAIHQAQETKNILKRG